MEAVISSWLNFVKIIFKPENETIYSTNDHLWRLKFAKYVVQEMKKIMLMRKVKGSTTWRKKKFFRGKKEISLSFNPYPTGAEGVPSLQCPQIPSYIFCLYLAMRNKLGGWLLLPKFNS